MDNKERAMLRSIASKTKSVFNVGKNGLSDEMIDQIKKYINAHELIKISVLNNGNVSAKEDAEEIASMVGAQLVETKGNTIVLYKRSDKQKIKHILD